MISPKPVRRAPRRSFSLRFNEALQRLLVRLKVDEVPHIKRVIVTVTGGTVIVLGFLMFLTPFPAVLVIPAGLAILGTEYAWARRWLQSARRVAKKAVSQTQLILSPRPPETVEELAAAQESEAARKRTVGSPKFRRW